MEQNWEPCIQIDAGRLIQLAYVIMAKTKIMAKAVEKLNRFYRQ